MLLALQYPRRFILKPFVIDFELAAGETDSIAGTRITVDASHPRFHMLMLLSYVQRLGLSSNQAAEALRQLTAAYIRLGFQFERQKGDFLLFDGQPVIYETADTVFNIGVGRYTLIYEKERLIPLGLNITDLYPPRVVSLSTNPLRVHTIDATGQLSGTQPYMRFMENLLCA